MIEIEADLHVHTVASGHAFSTVTEVCQAARKRGLRALALLDHGPAVPGGAHEYYFSNLIVLPEKIEGVQVLRGAEANIVNGKGKLDISDYTLELLDFVGVSFHPDCGYEARSAAENTEALLRALEHPNVRMICHPGVPGFELELSVVLEAAKERGILIEINNFSFNKQSFRAPTLAENLELITACAEAGCLIALNSDAHYHTLVGEVSLAARYLEELDFPLELIVNLRYERLKAFLASTQEV